ncbi:MAG: NrdH-redoxin [Chloroflexi bacterium]|nr:NrdH-redoxin [Chloroflexota bacterium]
MTDSAKKIIIYGTSWCGDTRRARQLFNDHTIDYEWVDIDQDQAGSKYVQSVNNGNRSVPTILFPDSSLLVEPSILQLKTKLGLS